jgi:hypothetical protein
VGSAKDCTVEPLGALAPASGSWLMTVPASAVADVLAREPVDWLLSSPLARAVQTAAPLAARLGRQPIIDDRFGFSLLPFSGISPSWT